MRSLRSEIERLGLPCTVHDAAYGELTIARNTGVLYMQGTHKIFQLPQKDGPMKYTRLAVAEAVLDSWDLDRRNDEQA